MISKTSILLSALVASVAAQQEDTEIIGGYKFIKSGPSVVRPKIQYEMAGARTALAVLKSRLGADGLIEALKPDIEEANAFWHDAIDKSTGTWVPADGKVGKFSPGACCGGPFFLFAIYPSVRPSVRPSVHLTVSMLVCPTG